MGKNTQNFDWWAHHLHNYMESMNFLILYFCEEICEIFLSLKILKRTW